MLFSIYHPLLNKFLVNNQEINLARSLDYCYYEWALWSKCLGKVLLIVGPTSSGKTTVLLDLLALFPEFSTINRKKLFAQAQLILQQQATVKGIETVTLRELLQHKQNTYFMQQLTAITFNLYYQEVKKYIFAGINVIIDDSLYNYYSYSLLHQGFNYYPNMKVLLLFNTLNDILAKCMIRNHKFLQLAKKFKGDQVLSILENLELITGNSNCSYRDPMEVIYRYLEFYAFTDQFKPDDLVLGKITSQEFKSLLYTINAGQLNFTKKLIKLQIKQPIRTMLRVPEEVTLKLFLDQDYHYIVNKIPCDFVIRSKELPMLGSINYRNKFIASVTEVLLWLTNHEKISTVIPEEWNNEYSTDPQIQAHNQALLFNAKLVATNKKYILPADPNYGSTIDVNKNRVSSNRICQQMF